MRGAARLYTATGLTEYAAEGILQAWGLHRRREFEDEVGYPRVSPSCAEFEAPPEWGQPRPPTSWVREGDIDRACWAMIVLLSRHARLHRDMTDHYRDGAKLPGARVREGRLVFARIWSEWDHLTQPVNAL